MKNKSSQMVIGNTVIGEGLPSYIIAEIGINHNGSLQIARQLIKVAAECGVNAVKFQKRNLKTLYQKKIVDQPSNGQRGVQYLLPLFKDFEFSLSDYKKILEYCQEFKVQFLCTAFDIASVDFLEKLHVPAYKIGSPDMTNFELLDYIVSKKKPLIVSTGMATWDEITKTVNFLKVRKSQFALLHCNSNYPAPFHSINLKLMPRLKDEFQCIIGYSGHEYGIAVSEAAVALGASIIERHFTLDRTMIGPDHAASLEPTGLKTLVRNIRQIEIALGSDTKIIDRGEFMNRQSLGKSLVAKTNIKNGTIISAKLITSKSPGTGISPQRIEELIGKKASRDIEEDEQFTESDIQVNNTFKTAKLTFKNPWGIMMRFSDLDLLYKRFKPPVVEFHLTEQDVLSDWKIEKNLDAQLIVHAPEYCGHDLFDLSSDEERIREKSLKQLKMVIEKTEQITPFFAKKNKPKIVIHPGGMYQNGPYQEDTDPEEVSKRLYANLAKSIQSVKSSTADLLLENMPPFPWYFGGQWRHMIFMESKEIEQFCKKNKINICLDISHAALYCNHSKTSLVDYMKQLMPLAKHLHIADASTGIDGEGLQIGEGSIDFVSIASIFKKYRGTFSPEIWQGHKECGEGFYQALLSLQKYGIL